MTNKDLEFVVLAAGKSTRNYPHSKGIPHKCLMPFGSVKIIDYIMNQIIEAGGKYITIVVPDENSINYFNDCFKKEPDIEEKFEKKGKKDSLELLKKVYIPDDIEIRYVIQKEPKGTGHAVAQVYNEIKDTNRTIVMIWPDDIIVSQGELIYKRVVDKYVSMGGGNLGITRCVEDPTRWGIVDNGYFKEKPKETTSNEAACGLFIFDNKVLEKLCEASVKMDNGESVDGVVGGELVFAAALNKTIDEDPEHQKIQTICMNDKDRYFDCGCIEGYEKALLYTLLYQSKFKDENRKFLSEIL